MPWSYKHLSICSVLHIQTAHMLYINTGSTLAEADMENQQFLLPFTFAPCKAMRLDSDVRELWTEFWLEFGWNQNCPLEAQRRKLCSQVSMRIWPLEAKHYFAYIEPDTLIKESTETQRGAAGQPLNPCVLWSSVHSHYWCWQRHRQREQK